MITSNFVTSLEIMNANNSSPNILVVDDMAINVILLKRILEKANYNVITAHNGIEAIDKMQNEKINLVLLDIRMPELDGIGVLERKKQMEAIKNIPVIMTSAFSEKDVIDESIEKGASAYIKKPIDRKELMCEMTRVLQNVQ